MPAVGTVAIADPELVFSIGEPGDQVLVSDWDGNGTDTFATYLHEAVYLSDGCDTFFPGWSGTSPGTGGVFWTWFNR